MLLCYKGKPLSVSFVARLMSTYFRVGDEGNRYPARYANVRFKFMRDVDEQMCRSLVHAKAKPAEGERFCLRGSLTKLDPYPSIY